MHIICKCRKLSKHYEMLNLEWSMNVIRKCGHLCTTFENSIVKKKSNPSDSAKFGIIRSNFDWRRFYTVKTQKPKISEFTD
jgi:hypothetical protein